MSEETKQLILSEAQKQEMCDNIARGIEYLDKNIPDWRSQINWDEFRFESIENCVWGKLRYKELGFQMTFPNPSEDMGWNVPRHIHRDAGCDDERHFTDDDVPRDICPYHFMHAEWLRHK